MPELFRDAALVAGEEFKRNIRRTGYRIITIAVPVILVLLTIIIPFAQDLLASPEEDPTPDGYVDNAGVISQQVADDTPELAQYENEGAGRGALLNGEIENLFIVPPDYLDSGTVRWLRQDTGLFQDEQATSRFRSLLTVGLIAGQVEPDLLERVLAPINFNQVRVTAEGTEEEFGGEEAARFLLVVAMAVILFFSVSFGSGYMIQAVTDEKENRMIEILATSLSPLEIMAGKIVGVSGVIFLQIGIWVASILILGPRVFQQLDGTLQLSIVGADMYIVTVLFFVAAYLLATGLSAIVSAITTSVREASQIGGIVILPFVIPLWLLGPLLESPDGTVARVMTFVPFTASITTVARVAVGDPPLLEVIASLAVVLLSAAVVMWVAARVFRAGMLLFGQRMSLRAMLHAVRYSA